MAKIEKTYNDGLRLLTVPGGGGSGPDHWHTYWEQDDSRIERVQQAIWDGGTLADWVDRLDSVIRSSTKPTILVAHSLGAVAVAHWAKQRTGPVIGALLVAPADVDDTGWVDHGSLYEHFRPIPMIKLPFPSLIVASSDDKYLTLSRAKAIASSWGSRLHAIGSKGHVGSDAKLKHWPEGQELLKHLIFESTRT